jgi:hypothetical protein
VLFTSKVVSIERLGPTRAASENTFEPVVSVLLAALLLSERLRPPQLVGSASVGLAVAILPVTSRQRGVGTHARDGAATWQSPGRRGRRW